MLQLFLNVNYVLFLVQLNFLKNFHRQGSVWCNQLCQHVLKSLTLVFNAYTEKAHNCKRNVCKRKYFDIVKHIHTHTNILLKIFECFGINQLIFLVLWVFTTNLIKIFVKEFISAFYIVFSLIIVSSFRYSLKNIIYKWRVCKL